MKISAILPVRDEVNSLRSLHKDLTDALRCYEPYEIIFVDDASSDGSFELLSQLAQEDGHVVLLGLRRLAGKSAAISVGFRHARGEILVTLDADGQDDPSEIPALMKVMEEADCDLVSGWKLNRCDPWPKLMWSSFFNRVLRLVFGIQLHDFNCGFKIYKAKVARDLALYGDLHRFIPVLAAGCGYKVGEAQVKHRPRLYGRSKYGARRIFSAPLDLITVIFLTHFLVRPLHLFGGLGALSGLAGFMICLYLTIGWIAQLWRISNRPLIFLGILLLIMGVQLLSIGLVCEMTIRTASGPLHTIPALREVSSRRERIEREP